MSSFGLALLLPSHQQTLHSTWYISKYHVVPYLLCCNMERTSGLVLPTAPPVTIHVRTWYIRVFYFVPPDFFFSSRTGIPVAGYSTWYLHGIPVCTLPAPGYLVPGTWYVVSYLDVPGTRYRYIQIHSMCNVVRFRLFGCSASGANSTGIPLSFLPDTSTW